MSSTSTRYNPKKRSEGAALDMMHVRLDPQIRQAIEAEAKRLDRSLSWVMRMAWNIASERISKLRAPGASP